MGLTKAQATIWQKARSLGNGAQAVGLTNECCAYLVGRIVQDLGLVDQFPEFDFRKPLPSFFSSEPLENLVVTGLDAKTHFERLVTLQADADTYFACLAAMHKARLKSSACTGFCRSSSWQRWNGPKSWSSRLFRSVSKTSVGVCIAVCRTTRAVIRLAHSQPVNLGS